MADAVRKTDDDAAVFAAFGRVFMADRKYDKARKYFQRATTLVPDIGDFWGMWIACETADEKPAAVSDIVEQAQKVLVLLYLCCMLHWYNVSSLG